MKKLLSLVLSLAMIFSMFGVVPMASAAGEAVPFGGSDFATYPEEFEDYTLEAGSSWDSYWEGDFNVWNNPWERQIVIQTLLSADGETWSENLTVEPGQKFKVRYRLAQNTYETEAIPALELVPILRRAMFAIDKTSGVFLNLEADGGYVDGEMAQFVYGTSAGRPIPTDVPMISLPFSSATGTPAGEVYDMCEFEVTASAEIAAGEYTITTDVWGGVVGFDNFDFITQNDEYTEPGWGVTAATVTVAGQEPEPDPEPATAPTVTLESITAPVNGWTVENWKREIANEVAVSVVDAEGFTSTVTVNGEAYTPGDAIKVSKEGQTFAVKVTTTAEGYIDTVTDYTITVGSHANITNADIATLPTITMSGSAGLEFVDVVTPATGRGAGAIKNWQKGATVAINVADNASANSTITVNGVEYVSGTEITLDTNAPLCVVVSTKEAGKISAVKVYDIVVTKAEKAILNSVTIDLNGDSVELINPDSSIRNKAEALTSFVKGGTNEMTISAVAEDGATVKVAIRGESSTEPLTTVLPYAAQFTAVVTVAKEGRQTASYVIDIPVKAAVKAPLQSVVISGIGEDVAVDAPAAGARTKAAPVTGFVKGEVNEITITPVVSEGLTAVVSFRGAQQANALTATLPYASQFTATITVKGDGYQTAYYVIDIPVMA